MPPRKFWAASKFFRTDDMAPPCRAKTAPAKSIPRAQNKACDNHLCHVKLQTPCFETQPKFIVSSL